MTMITFPQEQTKIETTSNYMYIGKSACGSADTDSKWFIKRATLVDGGVTEIKWANGNADPINKWSERATLEYK